MLEAASKKINVVLDPFKAEYLDATLDQESLNWVSTRLSHAPGIMKIGIDDGPLE